MKKVILGFAACALVLSSCTENDILENEPVAQKIEFSNLNDRVTKAANDSKSNYGVYAIWSKAVDSLYINNLSVNGETNKYAGAYYWPVGEGQTLSFLSFYAYAPYYASKSTSGGVTKLPAEGDSTIRYKVKNTADEDFTLATNKGINYNGTSTPVQLDFNHMLSKIKIVPALSDTLKLAGFVLDTTDVVAYIENVLYDEGTVSLANKKWKELTELDPTVSYNRNKSQGWTFMILPQPTNGIKIYLDKVKIEKNGVTYVEKIKTNKYEFKDSSTIKNFEPNTFYTITLTITGGTSGIFGSKIEFSSSVAEWTQEESKTVKP